MSNDATRLVTGVVRASYVNVFKPRETRNDDGSTKKQYSIALLIPKGDTQTMKALKAAAEAAKEKKWGGKPPSGLKMPWHDGDGDKPNGGEYGPECKGHWVVNANANVENPPKVVDRQVRPILDPAGFKSGDYCHVSLNLFGYDNKRKGVGVGLGNIQLVRSGEPLGSQRAPEDDFQVKAEEEGSEFD